MEVLLRGPSSLSRGERELIAAFVSDKNECSFCCSSHSAFAAHRLDGGKGLVEAVKRDPGSAPLSSMPVAVRIVPCRRSGLPRMRDRMNHRDDDTDERHDDEQLEAAVHPRTMTEPSVTVEVRRVKGM